MVHLPHPSLLLIRAASALPASSSAFSGLIGSRSGYRTGTLERSTIRERVIAGQKAAKRRGVRFGRPSVEVDTDRALKLRSQGLSWRAVAEATGIPKDTLIRHCEESNAKNKLYNDAATKNEGPYLAS